MAFMPGAVLRLLPENSYQTKITPTQAIVHTAVDAPGPTRLDKYFARVDVGVESHFWIELGGTIVQMMDTTVRADANRRANRRPDGTGAISIETEDEGDPVGIPWTDAQIDSIIRILVWLNETHDIPLVRADAPDAPGLGYHAMWGAPSDWTPAIGKTCPGPTRIKQFDDIIIPRLQEETKMNEAEALAFTHKLYGAITHRPGDAGGIDHWSNVFVGMTKVEALIFFIESASAEVDDLQDRVKELEALVEATVQLPTTVVTQQVDVSEVAAEVAEIIISRIASS